MNDPNQMRQTTNKATDRKIVASSILFGTENICPLVLCLFAINCLESDSQIFGQSRDLNFA